MLPLRLHLPADVVPVVLLVLTGAAVGSFLNVVIYRLPRRESVVHPGSRCPGCGDPVGWYDMIPVASYLWLRGRCRACRQAIPASYPLVEAGTAVLFCVLFLALGSSLAFLRYLVLLLLLLVAAEIDRREGIIPNRLLGPGALLGLALAAAPGEPAFGEALGAAAASAGVLLGLRGVSARWLGQPGMGMGDVKLAATTALFLGWENFWVFYLAAVLGGAMGLVGTGLGRLQRTSRLPFAPFVAAGAVLDLFLLPASVVLRSW